MLARRDFLRTAGAIAVGSAVTEPIFTSAASASAVLAEPPQTAFLDNNPRQVSDLLKSTGTAQGGDLTQHIGPLPNIRAALVAVGPG